MKKVLMLVHAFPPFRSVGHSIRAVKFIKYLPPLNWMPIVLTVDDRKEYEDYLKQGSESLLAEIPYNVQIHRTFAGEPSLEFVEKEKKWGRRNHFFALLAKVSGGMRRWAFRNLALPDRRIVWLPFAANLGRKIIKRLRVDVIFATCPPHSAAVVGSSLKLLTGKPLVLDFRDDWIDTPWHQSRNLLIQRIERQMEKWAVAKADKVVLVTEWSRKFFLNRYPSQPKDKFVLIPNGCDLEEFTILAAETEKTHPSAFTIMHTGSLNDSKSWTRNPEALFRAISHILMDQPDLAGKISLDFTGSLPDGYRKLVEELGLSGVVKELGFLPRDEWAYRMKTSDLLLVINYDGFSTLIPGKIYEYWAVGGPPILLLSCKGAASDFVSQHGLGFTVDPYDVEGIKQTILDVYHRAGTSSPLRIDSAGVETFDRRVLTGQLSLLLSDVCRPVQTLETD